MAIKVLLVDDSAVVRQVLSEIVRSQPDMELLGVAPDPIFALQKMEKAWPDVIVLDLEMPRMNGLTFLKKIMLERPTPIVICSSLVQEGTDAAMQAMALGAVEIVAKPTLGLKEFLYRSVADFSQAIRNASQARLKAIPSSGARLPVSTARVIEEEQLSVTTDSIVAMGSSTGGTQALEAVLAGLDRHCPGIAIVQHMPEKFTAAFAKRLNQVCQIEVKEAESGDRLINGRALIAPGGQHMEIKRSGAQYITHVFSAPPVNRHCPSVDVLFRSVAKCAGRNATGVILTGMGDDGARGLKDMRDQGARTIAQDEASCVVFGMPKEAIKLGAAQHIVSLDSVATMIMQAAPIAR